MDPGTTNFGVNVAGFVLHSAIHAARPDAKCVMHIHHPACVAVSLFLKQFIFFTLDGIKMERVLLGVCVEMWLFARQPRERRDRRGQLSRLLRHSRRSGRARPDPAESRTRQQSKLFPHTFIVNPK